MSGRPIAWLLLAVCLLTACGGGGGDTSGGSGNNGGTQPPSGIGSAGGTVNGPNGAKIVVPAGALAQNVNIAVAQSSTGAPALPAGLTAVSDMFALTPHGTQFAAPVTITIPFDASATNGATPLLYKTNAQGTWETVAGATFNSGLATAQISSFSYAQVVIPPLTRNEPTRSWIFRLWPGDGGDPIELENLVQEGGDLDQIIDFGESSSLTGEFSRLNETVLEDFIANGYVFGTNNGVTYGAVAEAPDGRLGTPEAIGSETLFGQAQSFVKNADDARLKYTITAVTIITEDFNPPLLTGPAPLVGQVTFELVGLEPQEFYRIAGTASLFGANDHFFYEAETSADSPEFLWFNEHFTIRNEDVAFEFPQDPTLSCEGTRATLKLVRPITIPVDISQIKTGEEFTVWSSVSAYTLNRRGGGGGADCQASYVGAFLRDPASIEGTTIEFEGLTPTNNPLPLEALQPRPDDPVVCTAATDPLPEAGTLQFEAQNFVVDESPNATPVIAITRTGGATGKVSANFATISGGTATSDEDYTEVNTTVYFADGESGRRLMRVPVRRDIRPEGDETVRIALSEPGGCAALGNQQKALLTIRDDSEIVPVLVFSVGGSVAGVKGSGLVIEEVTTGTRVTPTADGDFTFVYRFPQGTPYNVRIASNPTSPLQTCRVNNPTGTVTENITDVNVICTDRPSSGSLDTSFGSQGRVTTGLVGGAAAIALQSDGKIVALGDMRLARYNVDGTLDTTFGTAGQVAITLTGGLNDTTTDIAIQQDGRIVVVGAGRPGGSNARNDFAIARFNRDGTLDATFGTGGKAYVDFFANHDVANEVLIQPDGLILAIGHAATAAGTNDFAVARLTTAGVLDTTFDTDGKVNVNVAGDIDLAFTGALQADGAIVIAGEVAANNSNPSDTGLVRLLADGKLDTSFDNDGIVQIAFAADTDEADDIAIQADGKIVIVGPVLVGSTLDFMIARLNKDGSRDNSFGTAGLVTTGFGTLQDFARAVAIQPDGLIVAAGDASSTTASDFGIVRLRSDGTFDSSFGGGGSLVVDFFGSSDGAATLALQSDGKIVAAGAARNGTTTGVGLARIVP